MNQYEDSTYGESGGWSLSANNDDSFDEQYYRNAVALTRGRDIRCDRLDCERAATLVDMETALAFCSQACWDLSASKGIKFGKKGGKVGKSKGSKGRSRSKSRSRKGSSRSRSRSKSRKGGKSRSRSRKGGSRSSSRKGGSRSRSRSRKGSRSKSRDSKSRSRSKSSHSRSRSKSGRSRSGSKSRSNSLTRRLKGKGKSRSRSRSRKNKKDKRNKKDKKNKNNGDSGDSGGGAQQQQQQQQQQPQQPQQPQQQQQDNRRQQPQRQQPVYQSHPSSGRVYGRLIVSRRGGPGYWGPRGFGYGYGLWWSWRYPWFASAFPYSLWFPWANWTPQYIVINQQAVERWDTGIPVDPSQYQQVPEFGTLALPRLPTFAELGINVDAIKYDTQSLEPQQQAQVQAVSRRLTDELMKLRQAYQAEAKMGYYPVPDMDAARFAWVKQV